MMSGSSLTKVLVCAGLAGAVACSGSNGGPAPARSEFVGLWAGDTLPGDGLVGRVARLAVEADTQAMLALDFVGRGTVYHSGRWSFRGSELTLQPSNSSGEPTELPLVWRLEGERLVPVRWNRSVYGDSGLPLRRVEQPAAPQADSAPAQPAAAPQSGSGPGAPAAPAGGPGRVRR